MLKVTSARFDKRFGEKKGGIEVIDEMRLCSYLLTIEGEDGHFLLIVIWDRKNEKWEPNNISKLTENEYAQTYDFTSPFWVEIESILSQVESMLKKELFLEELKHGLVKGRAL